MFSCDFWKRYWESIRCTSSHNFYCSLVIIHTVTILGSFCWNQTPCKTSNRNKLKTNKLKWIIVMVKPEICSCKLASLKISGKFPRKNFVSIKTTSCKTLLKWTLLRVIQRNLTKNAAGYFSDKLFLIVFSIWTPSRECFWYGL